MAMLDARELDSTDYLIIRAVRDDARLSIRALARQVGVSAGTVSERLSRMEANGIIRGYRAIIDYAELGFGVRVLIAVNVSQQELGEMIPRLLAIPEVTRIDIVAGRWDLIMELQLRDREHMREVILNGIWRDSGFSRSETMIVLEGYTSDRLADVITGRSAQCDGDRQTCG